MGGQSAAFTCPDALPLGACIWWDTAALRWSTEGCSVLRIDETSVTCGCSHLTDFAVRFAAIEEAIEDVLAIDDALPALRMRWPWVMLVGVSATLTLTALLAWGGAVADAAGDARFAAALADGGAALPRALALAAGWALEEAREELALVASKARKGATQEGGEALGSGEGAAETVDAAAPHERPADAPPAAEWLAMPPRERTRAALLAKLADEPAGIARVEALAAAIPLDRA
jgi:hypothetical protein